MLRIWTILPAAGFFIAGALPATAQVVQLRHWSGQSISPAYEGYDVNADGTINMWFGYMNRNYEQQVDIPAGPDNGFSPGPADRGQPTHFLVRRQKDVFRVIVPKDFGEQKLVWTVKANGQVQQVTGSLKSVWMIDHDRTTRGGSIDAINSNTPPVVRLDPETATTAVGEALSIKLSATDDGMPKRAGKAVGMTAAWGKYRGPGTVTFEPLEEKLTGGATSTTARFSEPGEYILQVVVDDGSGELAGNFGYHCCWTNKQVRVTVKR